MRRNKPPLLSDQILAHLSVRSQSHPELSHMMGRTIGCIRTVNHHNRAMGYIEPIGKACNRAAGPVRWRITEDGMDRALKAGVIEA